VTGDNCPVMLKISSFCRQTALAAMLLGSAGAAGAQSQASQEKPGVISITSENDLFGGTDRNYTNGLRLERFGPADRVFPLLRSAADLVPFIDLEQTELRQGFGFSHAIFTPEDITLKTPDPADRPYAGWMSVSATAVASNPHSQDIVQLNLGVVGPAALGEFIQTNYHDLINAVDPQGWSSQLHNEPGIELIAQRTQLFDGPDLIFGLETDYGVNFGGALGNVRTYASTGAMARIGYDLSSDYGPPRIRPALSGAGIFEPGQPLGGYLFIGIEARAVGRDIFLDGNSFRDSPSVEDRRPFVGDIQAGATLHYRDIQLAFTFVQRTEQFKAQAGPQRFGAVSISVAR
jgi:lipid A 3-O-deacylase